MAKSFPISFHLFLCMIFLSIHHSAQLHSSQSQTLIKIRELLNYPSALSSFDSTADFCNIEPNRSLTLSCYEDNLTQLHIIGNNEFPPLPPNFSIDGFFQALGDLSSLKVVSLVSLGLWGSMPESIGNLYSLEILNVSSNYFHGVVPSQLSLLKNLQTVILDDNMFSGDVPNWLNLLPILSVLSLKKNSLTGSLPNCITSMENLRVLAVSRNNLSGEVPDLSRLRNLQVLDLDDNGFGPHFPSLHNKLSTLLLRKNRFRFEIPDDLESFYQLQKLDVSLNRFIGPFLPSLLSLPSIRYLDVSGNRFTGMLSENTSCNSELVYANLSSNLLTGELPSCLKLNSKSGRVVLYSENCFPGGNQEQHPYSFCRKEALAVQVSPRERKEKTPLGKVVITSSIMGGTVGGIALVGLVFMVTKRVYARETPKEPPTRLIRENLSIVDTAKLLSDARYISQTKKLGALGLPTYRTFALEEIKDATNNFDTSSFIGEGSRGKIYSGKLPNGSVVAIRSLKMAKRHGLQTYTHHIEQISKLRHTHLVSALGHCFDCYADDSTIGSIYLIFEFVPNGTLRGSVSAHPGAKLTWTQRIAAAIGVVKGIQFLHTGIVPGVYSNNLKIEDVLLDQNLHAKISSYNLPLLAENRRRGCSGAPPRTKDGFRMRVEHEGRDDVYDIGVILLEIIVGRPIIYQNEVGTLKDLLQVSILTDDTARRSIVDPSVHKECSDESLKTMMEICIRCLSNEPADRPSVEDVLWNLHFAAQVQDSMKGDSQNYHDSEVLSSLDL